MAEAPQAKSDYSFMKEMERHWQEEKNNPYKQPVGNSGGLFFVFMEQSKWRGRNYC